MSEPQMPPTPTEAPSEGRTSGAFGQAAQPAAPRTLATRLREAALAIVRDPNPILLKELRATLRTPLFVRFLYLCTGAVAIIVLMGSAAVSEGEAAPAEVGRAIYHIFFCALSLVLLFAAPSQAASAFTLEKETKTWESLLLSGMSPTRVVLGKFIAIYGSILLVVIAVAPVIGVGFLFGGVSPTAVLVGFFWLLGALTVAVSFGIALSVRLDSTRAAVSATTVIFVPLALMWSGFVVAAGEGARSAWGTPFDGPIWFGPAFAERSSEPDAWLLLLALPAFFFSMLTWLNLAGAIAGIDAPGVDRSSGLKVWSLYAGLGTAVTVVGATMLASTADDAGEMALVFAVMAQVVFVTIALVFANEPPLPPRTGAPKGGLWRFGYDLLGPGAGPTLRFTYLTLVLGLSAMCIGTMVVRHLRFPGSLDNEEGDLGAMFVLCGSASVLCAMAGTAAWLRALLRNGAAARLLAVVLFVALTFGSMVVASVIDPRAIDLIDRNVNPIIGLSPIGPIAVAIRFMDGRGPDEAEVGTALLACVMYGALAGALWLAVELRARHVARLVHEHREKLLARLGPVTAGVSVVVASGAAAPASASASAPAPEAAPASASASASAPASEAASAPASAPASEAAPVSDDGDPQP